MEFKTLEQIVDENPNLTGSEIKEIYEQLNHIQNNKLIAEWEAVQNEVDKLNEVDGIYYKYIFDDGEKAYYKLSNFVNQKDGAGYPAIYCNSEQIQLTVSNENPYLTHQIDISVAQKTKYKNFMLGNKRLESSKEEFYKIHDSITNIFEL